MGNNLVVHISTLTGNLLTVWVTHYLRRGTLTGCCCLVSAHPLVPDVLTTSGTVRASSDR